METEIADAIGQEGLERLISAFGGTRIYLPGSPGPDHKLTKLLGQEMATELAAHFATTSADGHSIGFLMDVPSGHSTKIANRVKLANDLHKKGHSINEIASFMNRNNRTIKRYLAAGRQSARGKSHGN